MGACACVRAGVRVERVGIRVCYARLVMMMNENMEIAPLLNINTSIWRYVEIQRTIIHHSTIHTRQGKH